MAVSTPEMESWLRKIIEPDAETRRLIVADYLKAIPELESLADVPRGTPVLVRGDVDAKPGATIGEGDIRLRSMTDTLNFGRQKGWTQVVFGHIGRKPEGSLSKVAKRIGEIMKCEVGFVADWLDEGSLAIKDEATAAIRKAGPGGIVVLENARKYSIETVLWKAKPADLPGLAAKLAKLASQYAEKIARVYVNEAFSAGSLDASTVVVPAAMDRVALGKYVAGQFQDPLADCLNALLVVSSGLKIDKLDDLEAMINRGKIHWVFVAGSFAVGLKKAAAQLEGGDFSIGLAEDPAKSKEPYYIPPERIEQAKRIIAEGRKKGIEFVLPVDFVLQDGRVSTTIGREDLQLDVGPATNQLFERKIGEFIEKTKGQPNRVAFHNGVFGKFEEPQFEGGTKRFMPQLKRLKEAGVRVYVGGGEGGKALEQYGAPDWVTHNFTAGGTVLNALGSEPVPYLAALRMAAMKKK